MKKRILFIINPIAGVRRKVRVPDLINRYLDKDKYVYEITYTERRGHATELASEAVSRGVDIVAVAGGDGSVNEVAGSLVGTSCTLAILPFGSGNGLARHLGYPMKMKDAIRLLNAGHVIDMDVGMVNSRYFFSLIGIGFDAYVAKVFDRERLRGLLTYAVISIRSVFRFRGYGYTIDGLPAEAKGRAFMINICNSNQYGFNVKIAPEASVCDGTLDMLVIREIPAFSAIGLVIKVLLRMQKGDKRMRDYKLDACVIHTDRPAYLQIDGETVNKTSRFEIGVKPSALKVIAKP